MIRPELRGSISACRKACFNSGYFVHHPFLKKYRIFCQFCLNGLWNRSNIWLSAHDQRDFDFAKKYNLEIIRVVDDKSTNKKNLKRSTLEMGLYNQNF